MSLVHLLSLSYTSGLQTAVAFQEENSLRKSATGSSTSAWTLSVSAFPLTLQKKGIPLTHLKAQRWPCGVNTPGLSQRAIHFRDGSRQHQQFRFPVFLCSMCISVKAEQHWK